MFKLQIKKDGQIIKSIPLDKAPTKEVIVHALNYDPNEKIQEAVNNLNKKNITDALGYEPPTTNKVNESISSLVNSAPEALDTLGELSTALGNDPNFSTTITNMIANKLNKTDTAKNSEKVNNLTIETAVPANAKFTDTTYSTATELEAGITKLYAKTGNNTDGTITQEVLTNLFNGKANASHGNHVPTTETANNARFLRNDNTWQTITPGNIGAAATSHTHSYLPITGGTMTGDLTFKTPTGKTCGFILTPADSTNSTYKRTNLDIGWNYANRDGAGFYIRSVDFDGITAGGFGAYARDASNHYDFYGLTSGLLQWAGPEFNIGGAKTNFKYNTSTGCLEITVT